MSVNVNTMEQHLAAKTLELNAIGVAELATDKPDGVRSPTPKAARWAGSS